MSPAPSVAQESPSGAQESQPGVCPATLGSRYSSPGSCPTALGACPSPKGAQESPSGARESPSGSCPTALGSSPTTKGAQESRVGSGESAVPAEKSTSGGRERAAGVVNRSMSRQGRRIVASGFNRSRGRAAAAAPRVCFSWDRRRLGGVLCADVGASSTPARRRGPRNSLSPPSPTPPPHPPTLPTADRSHVSRSTAAPRPALPGRRRDGRDRERCPPGTAA